MHRPRPHQWYEDDPRALAHASHALGPEHPQNDATPRNFRFEKYQQNAATLGLRTCPSAGVARDLGSHPHMDPNLTNMDMQFHNGY